MGIGRPTKPLDLTAEERDKLTMLARRPKSAQAMAMRARIVLGCDEGLSNGAVAKKLQITGATVCKWRERFRVNRLEGLLDEPRPGAPRSITDKQVEAVITKTLESMPVARTPLEHAADGGKGRLVADRCGANLACLWIATAPGGELQTFQRPSIR